MATKDHWDKLLNFRDVGAIVNEFLEKRLVREGVLYRAARPDWATEHDRSRLIDEYGIKNIIDLRTKTEQLKEANKHNLAPAKPAIIESQAEIMQKLRIPGVAYHDLGLLGKSFEAWVPQQLPWYLYIYLVALFVLGYRRQGTHLVGRRVISPLGLDGFSLLLLDQCSAEIASVLKTYIQPGGLPSLVHCSHGKDRTGLVVALVLMVLGVPLNAIDKDYRLSDGALDSERAERIIELRTLGFDESGLYTSPKMISTMQKHLDEKYGGIDAYLDGIGFSKEDRTRMRELMLY